MSFVDRRAYERIEYPTGVRPVLHWRDRTAEVLDCSERGVRLRLADGNWPTVSEELIGRVAFPTGVAVEVEGVVVRHREGELAVQFTMRWIPREVIQGEQRRRRLEAAAEVDPDTARP